MKISRVVEKCIRNFSFFVFVNLSRTQVIHVPKEIYFMFSCIVAFLVVQHFLAQCVGSENGMNKEQAKKKITRIREDEKNTLGCLNHDVIMKFEVKVS